jgi:hypothetical protein
MAPERERRDDAEVAAASAERPEEIRLALRIALHDRAVREHDGCRDEVVDRQAVAAREMADAAAERQTADARRADDADRKRQPVLVRRREDVLQQRPSSDTRHPRIGIDERRVHRREVDHEPVVDAAETAAVVAAAADRDPQPTVAREADRSGDVALVHAVGDCRRMLVDHRVVERTRLVVSRVVSSDHPPLDRSLESLRHGRCHCLLPRSWVTGTRRLRPYSSFITWPRTD